MNKIFDIDKVELTIGGKKIEGVEVESIEIDWDVKPVLQGICHEAKTIRHFKTSEDFEKWYSTYLGNLKTQGFFEEEIQRLKDTGKIEITDKEFGVEFTKTIVSVYNDWDVK